MNIGMSSAGLNSKLLWSLENQHIFILIVPIHIDISKCLGSINLSLFLTIVVRCYVENANQETGSIFFLKGGVGADVFSVQSCP